jgi:toxin ParE1/3/4
MPKFHLSKKAVEDLSNIWHYTFEHWSECQADKCYFELVSACKNLSRNHLLGKMYSEINESIFGFKSGQHIVFYDVIKDDEIEIIRFLHSRMDSKNKLQK